MNERRSYTSSLRTEQAAMTRDRIVDAAVELLNERDFADVGMQEVADRARVSVRTVYRNFATREDLLDGVVEGANERLGRAAGPLPGTPDAYVAAASRTAAAALDLEPYYRALFATAAGRAAHQRRRDERRAFLLKLFAKDLEGVRDDAAQRFAALMHLLTSSNAVLFLKDYGALPDDDIGRALHWATRVLTDALRDPALCQRLDGDDPQEGGS